MSSVRNRLADFPQLLPRYRYDNLFDSTKFAERFPEFRTTSYREGLATINAEQSAASA
ncbi:MULTISPECIES: hypothetical protein [unclassified Microbacterium]|uniref:hypothetical protein n=1 Tax=unclassified Microbacterium TaxID=2609290 RepID=UPI0018DF688C|nr:hypothetical protein [Microbacterium sp. MAH-37]